MTLAQQIEAQARACDRQRAIIDGHAVRAVLAGEGERDHLEALELTAKLLAFLEAEGRVAQAAWLFRLPAGLRAALVGLDAIELAARIGWVRPEDKS